MPNQERWGQLIGFAPPTPSNGVLTLALSAANTWLALSFVLAESKTLSKVKLLASAVAGTLGATDLTCDIYSDSSGSPGTSIESRNTVTATPTGAAWVEFTGFTTALTAGTRYWLVFKNANATPATNYPTFQWGGTDTSPFLLGSPSPSWGWTKKHTTDGSTWITAATNVSGLKLEFSDASFNGLPVQAAGYVTDYVYSTRELGTLITLPSTVKLNVRGMAMFLSKNGTPAGNLRYRIYDGTTLLATSDAVNIANVETTARWTPAYFSATQTLNAGLSLRAIAGITTGGDATNYIRCYGYTIENNADSKALLPWGAQRTYYNGTSWAETDTGILPFALILDTDGEFTATGSGGVSKARLLNTGF